MNMFEGKIENDIIDFLKSACGEQYDIAAAVYPMILRSKDPALNLLIV